MTKKLTQSLTYDAPAARVFAMLTTPEFREEVCARMKVISATARAETAGERVTVTIDQVQQATGLPSFATRIVGDTIHIVQEESWVSPTRADVHVRIPGKPGEMTGTVVLTESGGVTTEVVDLDIRVRVPLVGGRVEDLVAGMLRKALATENSVGREYLARKPS